MSGSNDHIDGNVRRYGKQAIAMAADRLQSGGLVAVPTETVYGLAADSTNAAAIADIYRTKGRPDFNPLIVHVPDMGSASELGIFNDLAATLAHKFWPGPLTLVVPKTADCRVVPAVTAGLDTIALRCPAHPVMQELLKATQLFLAAPSANKSGGISPTRAAHVENSLGSATPMILDGGSCESGVESTIVAIRGDNYEILRPGPVTAERLCESIGRPAIINQSPSIEAPGQLASHYAPSKPVRLNAETADHDEYHIGFGPISGHSCLSKNADLAEAASNLFATMHVADADDRPRIAVAPIPETGMGIAINDRLTRAAT
ncbi:L-threonylcarbamoyladenylate synthase [Parasphingorhabdus cellanae]|uniref:Threonylcarbamoyl-AMP synthase n=1 Tax=Parasphingorhabdus cellanae TaxID=2806553 RepID=A0ABX7T4H7_9SPHN|nr:L-threonylcarbamoyladenylate synthase [Parasphingorhabdus cellanae]QTD55002.1 threonylcarbamoyl-AMP synthase [Parasphingorhabdus cellanae]